jgi:hypothetical protein
MIAIDVTLSLRDTEPTLVTGIDKSEWDRSEQMIPYYTQMRDFFQACIDQNLILNACIGDVQVTTARYEKGRYFATTAEKAQEFVTKFCDMSAEFSMKKMWDQYGFDVSVEQHEIDFDEQPLPFEIIPADGDLFQYGDQAGTPVLPS